MDLKQLSQIDIKDLKNLDYKQIYEDLKKKPDLLTCVIAGVITVMFCLVFYSNRSKEVRTLRNELYTLEKKMKVIDEYHAIQKGLDEFVTAIPDRINEEKLISQITDFAESRNVRIESFSPSKKKDEKLYEMTSLNFNLKVKNYTDLWLFINDIEQSPYMIRIDNWRGAMGDPSSNRRRQRTAQEKEEESFIKVQLQIAAVNFKDDTETK